MIEAAVSLVLLLVASEALRYWLEFGSKRRASNERAIVQSVVEQMLDDACRSREP